MRTRTTPAPIVLAVAAVLAMTVAGCRHDGRDLAPPTVSGTQSILPSTTVDPDEEIVDEVDEVLPDEMDEEGDLDTLPGEDLVGDTSGVVEVDDEFSVALPFSQGEPIGEAYTCNGENLSPSVDWFDVPDGTVEIAVEFTDLQAPDYVHWLIAGLDPEIGHIEDGEVPAGAIQAMNSDGGLGYTGPCPPPGQTHTYIVTVSALDTQTELPDGADADTLRAVIGAATIASVTESGIYPA